MFKEVYKKLCKFDGIENELSIDSFIEITTQQHMNLNTNYIDGKIREQTDQDKNGYIDYKEFINLVHCLKTKQK